MSALSENSAGPAVPDPAVPSGASFFARERLHASLDDEQEGIGLKDLWITIRKRLWLLIGIMAGILLLVGIITVRKTPLYSATAMLLLKPDIPQVLDVPQLQQENAGTEEHDFYKTQYSLADSPEVAARVIRTLNLEKNPLFAAAKKPADFIGQARAFFSHLVTTIEYPWPHADRPGVEIPADLGVKPEIIEAYLRMLDVEPVAGTELMNITATTPDPMLSAEIANAQANAYIDRGLELRREAGEIVQTFLRAQLDTIGKQVQQSEAALNAYRRKMGILAFQTDNSNTLAADRMAELERALTDAETNRIRLGAEMQLIAAGHDSSLPEVIDDRTIEALQPEVDRLAAQYAGMATQFTDRWPALANVKARLESARAQLDQEVAIVTEGVRRQYQAALVREQRLEALVGAERKKDFASNDAALQDAILSRRVETNRELYRTVLKRMQEVGIADEGPVSNATVASAASVPQFPSSPKIVKTFAITVMGSLLIGLAVVLVLDKLDKRFKSVEEIERALRLPKFALIPDFTTVKRLLPAPKRGMARNVPQAIAGRQISGNGGIISALHTPSYSMHYQPLHVAMQFSRAGGAPRIIMFTSATPQEGKTVSAAGAAFASSSMGGRTLLIDADLHRPQCHNLVSTEDPIGLSDILAGHRGFADAVHSSANGVFVIPAGSRAPNPAALIASRSMRELLGVLGKAFDHVFLDTAPVLAASETIVLATMVDGVVLVVGSDTPRKAVLDAHAALRRAGAVVLGFVFNRVDMRLPQHRTYGTYRAYGGYGSYGAATYEKSVSDGMPNSPGSFGADGEAA